MSDNDKPDGPRMQGMFLHSLSMSDPMRPKLKVVQDDAGNDALNIEVRRDNHGMAACAVQLDNDNWLPLVLVPARALDVDETLIDDMTRFAQIVARVIVADLGTQEKAS